MERGREMEITLESGDIGELLGSGLVRGLMDSVSDGVLVIDANNRQILSMNRVARRVLGYEETQVVGCQCKKMMNAPACKSACPLTAVLEGRGEKSQLELYYRGRDGKSVMHAHTRMLLLRDPAGRPLAGVELFRDLREVRALREALKQRRSVEGIVGSSEVLRELSLLVEQIAPYDLSVLITGESGVGKERFADALHGLSRRSGGPFVKVNCAALSPQLVESELFGHCRGAFTGASHERKGCFEEANGGTLLLDEVGELPLSLQAKLLRVLQEGELQRVGEERLRKVDVRILSATNRELELDVMRGVFRKDLYYRLQGARLHIPPLRERRLDIPVLSEHFLRLFRGVSSDVSGPSSISPEALRLLVEYDWPGNVRELENVLRLAMIKAGHSTRLPAAAIESSMSRMPGEFCQKTRVPKEEGAVDISNSGQGGGVGAGLSLDLAHLEREAIERAMSQAGSNISAAARLLGIDRSTLWRKLKRSRG